MAKKASVPALAASSATHIVLFRQVSESNISAVRSVLKVEQGKASAKGLKGVTALGRNNERRAMMYHDLGVASATMTDDQAAAMEQREDIEAVFPNEVRKIPKPVAGRPGSAAGAGGDAGFDYLRGLRDGIDAALQNLSGGTINLAVTQRRPRQSVMDFLDTGDWTWGLQAVGLASGGKFTAKGIKVAVLDTGIDLNHPDIRGRVVEGRNGKSMVPGESLQDGHSHGTHCCGTVAGPLNHGGLRRYGVAPDADLLVGKVLNNSGSGTDEWILDGIQWAVDQGARIISMSLGSARRVNEPFSLFYERIAERLLRANPGTIIVAAAGNDSERPLFVAPVGNPAACPSILSVAAVDKALRVAPFSCGQVDGIGEVNIAAPGMDVYSSVIGGYDSFNGTSMAAPHVAGLAALILGSDPNMTASELWDRLVTTAKPLGQPADFGSGIAQLA